MHQTFPGDNCLHPSEVKVLKLDDPQNERLNGAMMILMPAKSPPHVVYAAQWVADKLQCCMQGMFNEARHHVHPYSVHFTRKSCSLFFGPENFMMHIEMLPDGSRCRELVQPNARVRLSLAVCHRGNHREQQ